MKTTHPVILRKVHMPGQDHPACVCCGERVFATADEVLWLHWTEGATAR